MESGEGKYVKYSVWSSVTIALTSHVSQEIINITHSTRTNNILKDNKKIR
jgi:hypothetical protein